MLLALTRAVPISIDRCELTHLAREPIDYARAVQQHEAYERALEALGCRIERLPEMPDLPDSVFVEDTAVVLDEVAVITRPGAESRRPEIETVAAALSRYRRLAFIQPPATLDGGDVLRIGSTLFVGMTPRTNAEGIRQLADAAEAECIHVRPVAVTGCLHLKSAVTVAAVDPLTLILNPEWVDPGAFGGPRTIDVDPGEPFAANVLLVRRHHVLCAAEFPRTIGRLEATGVRTLPVPAGELAKAEGGVTCGSLLVRLPD